MDFVKHRTSNVNFAAPADWDAESNGECGTLPITAHRNEEGETLLTSFWKPTPEELEALNANGALMLTVWGRSHPVVRIDVTLDT